MQPRVPKPIPRRGRAVLKATLAAAGLVLLGAAACSVYYLQLDRQADRWLERAAELERQGALGQSANALQHYTRLRPDDADAARRLADLRASTARTFDEKRRALVLYNKALKLHPADSAAQAHRAQLLLELGDAGSALQVSRRLLLLGNSQPIAQRTLALALIASGMSDSSEVLPACAAAVESHPGDFPLALAIARYCCQVDRHPSATDHVRTMLDGLVTRHPERPEVWLLRYSYRKHRHLPYAADDLRQALRLGGQDHVSVLLAAGEHSLERRRWATARHHYRRAVAQQPQDFRAHLGLGLSYRGQQRPREASLVWETALEHVQGISRIHLYYALVESNLDEGHAGSARIWLQRSETVLREFPTSFDALTRTRLHLLRAQTKLISGNYQQALRDYQRFLEGLPAGGTGSLRAAAHEQVAQCYVALKRWPLAAVHYQAAAELRSSETAWLKAGMCWERGGCCEQAVTAYRATIQHGDLPQAHRRLLELLCRTGQIAQASEHAAVLRTRPAGAAALDAWHFDALLDKARWQRVLWRPLALYLARHGQAEAAVALCLAQAGQYPTADNAVGLATILSYSSPEPAMQAVAEATLQSRVQRHTSHVELLAAMGTLRLTQGRLDEARHFFQQVLLEDPGHIQTLNNLALVLIQQPGAAQQALVYIDQAIRCVGPQPELLDTRRQVTEAIAAADAEHRDHPSHTLPAGDAS